MGKSGCDNEVLFWCNMLVILDQHQSFKSINPTMHAYHQSRHRQPREKSLTFIEDIIERGGSLISLYDIIDSSKKVMFRNLTCNPQPSKSIPGGKTALIRNDLTQFFNSLQIITKTNSTPPVYVNWL